MLNSVENPRNPPIHPQAFVDGVITWGEYYERHCKAAREFASTEWWYSHISVLLNHWFRITHGDNGYPYFGSIAMRWEAAKLLKEYYVNHVMESADPERDAVGQKMGRNK